MEGESKGKMKPPQSIQPRWAPQCEAALAFGLGAPLQKEGE